MDDRPTTDDTMLSTKALLIALGTLTAAAHASAGSFQFSSDRAGFEAALAEPYRTETFGLDYAFPIRSGVLDATTNEATDYGGPVLPGRVLPGVTYSTPTGNGYILNLDSGAGYDGAFLDGFYGDDPHRRLTITFAAPVAAFGFETSEIAPNLEVVVRFTDGTSQSLATTVGDRRFLGFTSADSTRIASAVIGGDGNSVFAFAVDNVTFTAAVPEPASWAFMAGGLALLAVRSRRRR